MKHHKKSNYFVIMGIISAVLFSLATPLSKLLLIELNEFLLAGLLYFGGALGILPMIIWKKEFRWIPPIKKFKKERRNVLLSVVFGGIFGPIFLMFGLQLAKAGSVAIWLNMELVATGLIGVLFFKESLDRNGIIGLIAMVLAGVFVTIQEGFKGGISGVLSAGLVVLACLCWGVDNHTTGIIEHLSAAQITFIKGVVAGLINILIGLVLKVFQEGNWKFLTINYTGQIGLSLLLGAFSYGISILLYIITAQQMGSTRGQILFSSSPILGVLFSFIILQESLGWFHLVAVLFTIGGIFFSNKKTHGHSHTHAPITHMHMHGHDDEHHSHLQDDDDEEKEVLHSHEHNHEKQEHSHKHFPDVHHRHH